MNSKLSQLFHFTVEVGCEPRGEQESPRMRLLWEGDLIISSSLALLRWHPGISQKYVSDTRGWEGELTAGNIQMGTQTIDWHSWWPVEQLTSSTLVQLLCDPSGEAGSLLSPRAKVGFWLIWIHQSNSTPLADKTKWVYDTVQANKEERDVFWITCGKALLCVKYEKHKMQRFFPCFGCSYEDVV